MALPADMRRSYLGRQLGTLAVSPFERDNAMSLVHVASWHNTMLRLGLPLPLFMIHDVGLTLSGQGRIVRDSVSAQLGIDPRLLDSYADTLQQIAESELTQAVSSWRLRDDLMAVLLSRLLGEIWQRWRGSRLWVGTSEIPLDPGIYLDIDAQGLYSEFDSSPVLGLLHHLVQHQLYLLTAVEQVDLDTLRLLGLFDAGNTFGGAMDIADLLNVFSSPEANGVVNFSMELLPSVLETRRQSGVQTFSIDGYASIERAGSIDSIVLTEFAYDDDIFMQKVIDDELYYYGHEKQRIEERRLHYILVDASASMRGEREVFGRGLALTLSKKLSLLGDEVWMRFFDSRLYEVLRISGNPEAAVPQLLCFRSERGRNYGRVFRQLLGELSRLRRQDERDLVLYMITHGQCHIGVDVVKHLSAVAQLYGVFILPSSSLHLDYLPLMHKHQIVTKEVLSSRKRSVDRALEIVDDAAAEADATQVGDRGPA
jgi:hypothetical protein